MFLVFILSLWLSMRLPRNQLSLNGLFPKKGDTLPPPHAVLLWFKDTFGPPPLPDDWLRVSLPQQSYIAPGEAEISPVLEHRGLILFLCSRYLKSHGLILVQEGLLLQSLNVQSATQSLQQCQ